MKRLKRLFCNHNWEYLGREYVSLSHHWKCKKCGKNKYKYEATGSKVDLKTLEIDFTH